MRVPPRWVRRTVVAPAVVVAALVLLTTAPLWLLVVMALGATVPGYGRVPRVAWMVTFYLLWDAAALVTALGLWIGSGFGWKLRSPRFQRAHYVVTAAFLRALFWQVRRVLRLDIRLVGADLDALAASGAPGRPLLVASRHAGPGDSFILVHLLFNRFSREPRIVLKDSLQWDPAIDVMLNRLPSRFIAPSPFTAAGTPRSSALAREVGALARGLDGDDAFLIFPEGGNFSPERRRRRIERLRRAGLHALADRAAAMHNVLAPRPGGLLAALDAAPDADVLFVAHTGLDRMVTVGDVWRELPMDKQIVLRGWYVPREEIPAGDDARGEWLFAWFERIDRWIEDNRPPDRLATSA